MITMDKAYSRIRKIRCAMPGRSTVYYLVNKPDKLLKTSFEISGSDIGGLLRCKKVIEDACHVMKL